MKLFAILIIACPSIAKQQYYWHSAKPSLLSSNTVYQAPQAVCCMVKEMYMALDVMLPDYWYIMSL